VPPRIHPSGLPTLLIAVLLTAARLAGQSTTAADTAGASAIGASSSLPLLWQTDAGRGATASPLVTGERLYLATARKAVKAFDLDGPRELWSRDLARGFQASPRLAGGLLVVVAPHPDAEATGLDPRTGETRWTSKVGDVTQPPLIDGTRVIFVSIGGWVRALDAATGGKIWETRLEGFFPGGSLLGDGSLIVLSASGTLFRLESATGRRLGSFDLGARATPELIPLPGGREFLAATFEGRMRSLGFDLTPGSLDVTGAPLLHAPAAGSGILCAPGKDRRLRAYGLPSGDPIWERPFEVAAAAPPAVSPDGSRIAASTLSGEVWILAAADGRELARTSLNGAPATPVWTNGRLAVVTDGGVLALLDASSGGAPASTPAPNATSPRDGHSPFQQPLVDPRS
jgi:outer membrane protein assembly factor BamB